MNALLEVYLQDHHAGATGGTELARRAARANRDSPYGRELEAIASEIAEDLATLEGLMDTIGVGPDRRKDAMSWVGEKLGRLKRNGTWISYSPLSRLVELEGLVLGVSGKLALWEALGDTDPEIPVQLDFDQLAARARDQRSRLEALRRRAAREALAQPQS
jgi:hypothetical protein